MSRDSGLSTTHIAQCPVPHGQSAREHIGASHRHAPFPRNLSMASGLGQASVACSRASLGPSHQGALWSSSVMSDASERRRVIGVSPLLDPASLAVAREQCLSPPGKVSQTEWRAWLGPKTPADSPSRI